MLDHVFTDAIDALRQSLEGALLERIAVEEHLHSDILLGDLTWETSYGLLGESTPPRVRADISMSWPTWSQSAFRTWYVGDGLAEAPAIDLEITLRVEGLVTSPDVALVYGSMPEAGPGLGGAPLRRSGPTLEQSFSGDLDHTQAAFEVVYEGTYELGEEALEDSSIIDEAVGELGGWIASALVRLNDLPLSYVG